MRDRLRQDLTAAMKARDSVAVSALRSALAAIDNAEAVATSGLAPTSSEHVAGAALGVGAAEVERTALSDDAVRHLLVGERDERLAAATTFDRHGEGERAAQLREQAGVLGRYLAT